MQGSLTLRALLASLALATLLCGCAPMGVGVAADNRGAAVGVSTGVPLPTVNAPRSTWQPLPPPPRLVDPAPTDDAPDTRKSTP